MKRKLTMLLSLVLMAAVLAACGGTKPQDVYKKSPKGDGGGQDAPTVTLKIGQLPIIDGLPFWVAEKENHYVEQGVNVELITFKSALERDAALAAGQIDGALTDHVGAITAYNGGTKLRITSLALGATQSEGPVAILAAPNSGIESVEDLKGVEVAISTNSFMHYVSEKLLLDNGLTAEEIKFNNIVQIPLRFEALMAGQVKAAILPDPLLSLAVAKGAKVILDDTKAKQNYSQSFIVFTDKAIQEKGEGIKRFFHAYNLGVFDIKQDGARYKDLLVEQARVPAEIKDSFQVSPFSPAQAPQKADVEAVVEWLYAKQLIKEKYTYEELVNVTLTPQAQ